MQAAIAANDVCARGRSKRHLKSCFSCDRKNNNSLFSFDNLLSYIVIFCEKCIGNIAKQFFYMRNIWIVYTLSKT